MSDMVNHPKHYTQGSMECIDLVEHMPFSLGSSMKYAWRYQAKGTPIQDLEKCRWYLRRKASGMTPKSLTNAGSVDMLRRAAKEAPTQLARSMANHALLFGGLVNKTQVESMIGFVNMALAMEGALWT